MWYTDDVQAATKSIGAVDVLFNRAGYVHQDTILVCSVADRDFSFDLNVRSMFVLTKAMLPKMIGAGGGRRLHARTGGRSRQAGLPRLLCPPGHRGYAVTW